MSKTMHLNLFIHNRGHHEAAWRHPKATKMSVYDVRYYQQLAQIAEKGLLDSVFFADQLALPEDITNGPRTGLEPITTLAAVAAVTSHVGLIATASTTYTEPFNLARQFCSLDHISDGRIGWNIVTSWMATAATNFSAESPISHAERYARGEEFMTVAKKLWDSWAPDAVSDDRENGVFVAPGRFAPIDHSGTYYKVSGPLNLPRCPQGRPVLVQAGSSESGRAFAARHAEAIFTAQLAKSSAQHFYRDIKTRVAAEGRAPEHTLILPGLSPIIGSTEFEARRLADELGELANPEAGRKRMSARFGGHDFSHLDLDRTLSPEDFPDPETIEAARSRTEVIINLVRQEKLTLRQLLAKLAGARGHHTFAGTPEQLVDLMEDWVKDRAADGFNVMPPILPMMLETFIEEVVPIMQKRGLFRTAYGGATLRAHYGLPEPEGQYR
ncbi:MAG: LLM class flavin-dependent oxidoreductase [Hyphomicrobiaceae bacterium]